MAEPMLIGITGHFGAGKDSVWEHLRTLAGYKRFAFADPLKELAKRVGWDESKRRPHEYIHLGHGKRTFWPGAYNGRLLLQELGTGAREILGTDVWIRALKQQLDAFPGIRAVVTDVRFINEAEAIWDWGGDVWRVERPGFDGDGSASEVEVDMIDVDATIANDGTLDDLYDRVLAALYGEPAQAKEA